MTLQNHKARLLLNHYFIISGYPIWQQMIVYLETTDYTIREDIMVAILEDKCAEDYMRYEYVMVNLVILAVDYVSKEDWQRAMRNINKCSGNVFYSWGRLSFLLLIDLDQQSKS